MVFCLKPPNCGQGQPTPSNLLESQAPVLTIAYPQPTVRTTIGGGYDFDQRASRPGYLASIGAQVLLTTAVDRNWYPRNRGQPSLPPLDEPDPRLVRTIDSIIKLPEQQYFNQVPPIEVNRPDIEIKKPRIHIQPGTPPEFVTPRPFPDIKKSILKRHLLRTIRETRKDEKRTMDVATGVVYIAEVGDLNSNEGIL